MRRSALFRIFSQNFHFFRIFSQKNSLFSQIFAKFSLFSHFFAKKLTFFAFFRKIFTFFAFFRKKTHFFHKFSQKNSLFSHFFAKFSLFSHFFAKKLIFFAKKLRLTINLVHPNDEKLTLPRTFEKIFEYVDNQFSLICPKVHNFHKSNFAKYCNVPHTSKLIAFLCTVESVFVENFP